MHESFQVKTVLSKTRVPSITVHVPGRHRLDNENDHTKNKNWNPVDPLEPAGRLDFADDLALLSPSHEQMQEKTDLLNLVSAQTGRNINMNKTKIMKANTKSKNVVTVGGKPLEETDCFTYIYLGRKINKTGGTEEDTKDRIQKARVAFLMLSKIWKSKLIKLKMRIFNSSVKSVLFNSSETWRITKHTVNKIQTFVNRCLQRIMNVKWSGKVSNNTLWTKTNQLPVEIEIKRRKWRWIGHTLRKNYI